MKLADRLLLFDYITSLLGGNADELREDLQRAESGRRPDGQSHYFSRLESRGALIAIDRTKLAAYDSNILRIEEKLGRGRPGFRFTYFQWLAALYTEIYLDRLANEPQKLLAALRKYRSANLQGAVTRVTRKDLHKAALWMATGSGKTLLAHANLLQFEHYKPFEPDNIVLVTPNEGLSAQHLDELALSGIPAHHAIYDTRGRGVQVLEITKLYVDRRDDEGPRSGVRLPTSAFEGQNLLLVDEGHKGNTTKSDQQEELKWRDIRERLAGDHGFTFEYSATFAQITESNDELLDEYAKTILFDYGYKHFWDDGYGKDYRVVNLKEAGAFDVDDLLFAGLLVLYEQSKYFSDHADVLPLYNIEAPLMVLVGQTVTGQTEAEVLQIIEFLDRVLRNRSWAVDLVEALLAGTSELPADLFTHTYPYASGLGLTPDEMYDDLCVRLFKGHGKLSLHMLRRADGEIGLRTADSAKDVYCGVVNVGNASRLLKNAVEAGIDAGEDDHIADSVFDAIDNPNSPVSFLIGAKKFIEGWSSWRVSVMGLLKVGKSAGPQVIQLFGRGVRLKGKDTSLKRSGFVPGDHPSRISLVETLFIFGLRADYMQTFNEAVRREGVPPPVTRVLPIRCLRDLESVGLRAPDPGDYDFLRDDVVVFDPATLRNPIAIDLMPTFAVSEGIGDARQSDGEAPTLIRDLPAGLVDRESLYLSLLDFKRRRGWFNTYVTRTAVALFLETRVELTAPEWVFDGEGERSRSLLQSAAEDASRKGLERFVYTEQRIRETRNLSPELVDTSHPNFPLTRVGDTQIPAYRLEVPEDVVKEVDDLIAAIGAGTAGLDDLSEPLPRLHVDSHLYNPILIKESDVGEGGQQLGIFSEVALRSVPSGLVASEVTFIRDLRDAWDDCVDDARWAEYEIYLLRNLPRKGVGFFQTAGFYPDFMLWLKKGDLQSLAFVEPHGMVIWDPAKVDLLADIGRMGLSVPTLGYIVTSTPPRSIGAIGGGRSDIEWLRDHHILLQGSTEYMQEILGDLRRAIEADEAGQYAEGDPVASVRLAAELILPDEEISDERRFVDYLPVYSLEAAAGYFGESQDVERIGWARVDGRLGDNLFVAKAVGQSMEPRIHDGDLCVFRKYEAGSREGLTVLVQWAGVEDPDTGGSYAVKRYSSKKRVVGGELQGYEVTLFPTNPDYEPIVLTPEFEQEVRVVAVLVDVLKPPHS